MYARIMGSTAILPETLAKLHISLCRGGFLLLHAYGFRTKKPYRRLDMRKPAGRK